MAYATQLTIGTGRKVSMNYQSQDATVTVTYQLEQHDKSVLDVVKEKAVELEKAHRSIWGTLKEMAAASPHPAMENSHDHTNSVEDTDSPPTNGQGFNGEAHNGHRPMQYRPANGYREPRNSPRHQERVQDPLTEPQERAIKALMYRNEMTWDDMHRLLETRFGVRRTDALTKMQASQLLTELQRKARNSITRT